MSECEHAEKSTDDRLSCAVHVENYFFFWQSIVIEKKRQDLGKDDTGRSFTLWMTPYLLFPALGKASKLFDLIFLTFKVGEFNTCSEG